MSRPETVPVSRPPALFPRLSGMMFLQYAIWGAWLPLLWPFLRTHHGFEPAQIGDMFAVGAVGAIIAPFVAGQIADRWFPTQYFLGICHLLGAVLVWQLASLSGYGAFLVCSLLYSVLYSPTLSLTNSLAFHHLPDRDRDFGKIRVFGTIGWVTVGICIGQWLAAKHTPTPDLSAFVVTPPEGLTGAAAEAFRTDALKTMGDEIVAKAQAAGMADAFRLSAVLGAIMGVFCFTLPHTPPTRGTEKSAFAEAFREVRKQPLITLFLLAVPVSCIHQFYFVHTAGFLGDLQRDSSISTGLSEAIAGIFGVGGGGLMTIGQASEIAVLAAIPLVAKKVSRKWLLAVGLVAYAVRMACFAYHGAITETLGIPTMAVVIFGVVNHGLCFGCFIFVAFMIVDEESSKDARASAQSLFNLVIIGIGIIVGSKIADRVAAWAESGGEGMDYGRLFSVPMWASLACLLLLLVFYPARGPRRGELPPA